MRQRFANLRAAALDCVLLGLLTGQSIQCKWVISKAGWRLRREQWREYRSWAAAESPALHPPDQVIADIGTILEWIPESVRREDRDPDRQGVRRMHYLLGLLSNSR
jgi:hypothetical protein